MHLMAIVLCCLFPAYTHTHTHVHTCTRTCTHTHTHTHTYTHPHMHRFSNPVTTIEEYEETGPSAVSMDMRDNPLYESQVRIGRINSTRPQLCATCLNTHLAGSPLLCFLNVLMIQGSCLLPFRILQFHCRSDLTLVFDYIRRHCSPLY